MSISSRTAIRLLRLAFEQFHRAFKCKASMCATLASRHKRFGTKKKLAILRVAPLDCGVCSRKQDYTLILELHQFVLHCFLNASTAARSSLTKYNVFSSMLM